MVLERSGKGPCNVDRGPCRFRSSKGGDVPRLKQHRRRVLLGCSSAVGMVVLRTQGMQGEGEDTILASCIRMGQDIGTCVHKEDNIRQGASQPQAWDHSLHCKVTQRGRCQWPLQASLGVTFHLFRKACNASNYEKN